LTGGPAPTILALLFVASYAYGGQQRGRWRPTPGSPRSAARSPASPARSPMPAVRRRRNYLLPLRLDKTVFVATSVIFFAAVNVAKLVPYALLGQPSFTNLGTALVLSPLAALGMALGLRLHHRVDPATFYRLCYVFVALTGLKLIYDGLI
jgi:hypothetical protein